MPAEIVTTLSPYWRIEGDGDPESPSSSGTAKVIRNGYGMNVGSVLEDSIVAYQNDSFSVGFTGSLPRRLAVSERASSLLLIVELTRCGHVRG